VLGCADLMRASKDGSPSTPVPGAPTTPIARPTGLRPNVRINLAGEQWRGFMMWLPCGHCGERGRRLRPLCVFAAIGQLRCYHDSPVGQWPATIGVGLRRHAL
jgi:hypothetical protein